MNYTTIRKKLGLSQMEMAVLLGVPVGTLRGWEQGNREPDSSAKTLYALAEEKEMPVIRSLVVIACGKKYQSLAEINSVRRLVAKLLNSKLLCAVAEMRILENNPQFTPKQLGFRSISIVPPKVEVRDVSGNR